MKKNSKKAFITIAIASTAVIAGMIIILVLIFGRYKPNKKTLEIINEASVMLYDSEITDEYKQISKQKTDDVTFYKFEFKLENGEKAVFEFAKDLESTYLLYVYEEDIKTPVLLNNEENKDLDNVGEWLDEWSN